MLFNLKLIYPKLTKRHLIIVCGAIVLHIGFVPYTIAQCIVGHISSFQPGEKIKFKAYYHLLWDTYAADIQFSVNKEIYGDEPAYFFKATGSTVQKFDWIFKVCDNMQACASMQTLNPFWAKRETSEGDYFARENYRFLPSGMKIYAEVQNSSHPSLRDSLNVSGCAFDALTLVYYCRTLDFSKYKKNDKIPVNIIVDGSLYHIYIRYCKKVVVKNRIDDKKYKCIELSVLCIQGSIFDGGENLKIWVTDDENKIPVKIQADIQVGTIFGYISAMEGLKNRINALVN
jgi:Protein of unknown function (DUF3108).